MTRAALHLQRESLIDWNVDILLLTRDLTGHWKNQACKDCSVIGDPNTFTNALVANVSYDEKHRGYKPQDL